MKVLDLIKLLEQVPDDAEVRLMDYDNDPKHVLVGALHDAPVLMFVPYGAHLPADIRDNFTGLEWEQV